MQINEVSIFLYEIVSKWLTIIIIKLNVKVTAIHETATL